MDMVVSQSQMSSTSTVFASDYSLTPTQSRLGDMPHPQPLVQTISVSPTKPCPLSPTPRAVPTTDTLGSPMPSPTPRRRVLSGSSFKLKGRASLTKLNSRMDTYPACMEGGIAHETRSQALGHAGPIAERHLRAAAAHFEAALAHQQLPWPGLRLATVLYHLSSHCRPAEAADLLRTARHTLLDQDSGPAIEARAAICARLSALVRMPSDTLWESEAGLCAFEALDAFEDVAAERMDRASALSKAAFEPETPALAATFLALAEAAAAVCTLSREVESADSHAELADHALSHAANMATLSRAPALVTHIQLANARLAAERLKFYARFKEDSGWYELIVEMSVLASQTRERAQKLRGSRGAAAAEQASEAAKLLADARVMHAHGLGMERRYPPLSPNSVRSAPTAPVTPVSATLATPRSAEVWSPDPPAPTPGLSSSSGSWSSSTGSPPIPEEHEEGEDHGQCVVPSPMPEVVIPSTSSTAPLLSPTGLSPTRKRAPPPPPLKLAQRPPRPPQAMTPLHRPPLSPLNPARRASDLPSRPRLIRGPSFNSPRRATWMSSSLDSEPSSPMSSRRRPASTPPLSSAQQQWNQLAAAGKGYKLALSILSSANLPSAERARRKSELLFAIATTALARAEIAPRVAHASSPSAAHSHSHSLSASASYFSPTAPHASPESLQSLQRLSHSTRSLSIHKHHGHAHGHVRHHSYPRSPAVHASIRLAPATPRPDPRSGTRTTGAAALRATAEVYAAWAAREVGWSAVIDPSGASADRRTGAAAADEAGLRAVLLAVRVWWVRASAGDDVDVEGEVIGCEVDSASDAWTESPRSERTDEEGDAPDRTFGLYPPAARRIAGVLARLRDESAGRNDVRRFVAPFTLGEDEQRFWAEVEDVLA